VPGYPWTVPSTAREPRAALRRWVDSISRDRSDLHAEAVRLETQGSGATHICDCRAGEPASVAGVLRSVTLRPREGVPAVEAELFDGTGRVLLVWLGRRRIRGVEPGRRIVAQGRLTGSPDFPTLFNPQYELRTRVGSES
jgi:hypothetical protein